jgi:hypothetical protein
MRNANVGIAHVSVIVAFVLIAIEMFVTLAVLSTAMIIVHMVKSVKQSTDWSAVILYGCDTSVAHAFDATKFKC